MKLKHKYSDSKIAWSLPFQLQGRDQLDAVLCLWGSPCCGLRSQGSAFLSSMVLAPPWMFFQCFSVHLFIILFVFSLCCSHSLGSLPEPQFGADSCHFLPRCVESSQLPSVHWALPCECVRYQVWSFPRVSSPVQWLSPQLWESLHLHKTLTRPSKPKKVFPQLEMC